MEISGMKLKTSFVPWYVQNLFLIVKSIFLGSSSYDKADATFLN